ncbi:MAG: CBS and ACT domain-containing protein [Proteobacteria bacterium]|nr:CBS and ACT domain-containing protein [Pseudomonadota bacterium]
MLVKDWMHKEVVTIDVGDSMLEAGKLLKNHNIRMLPVLKKGQLVGVVTDRDLKRASASDASSLEVHELLYLIGKIKIGDVMSKNPVTVPPDFTIEETAELLLSKKISGAPVVNGGGNILGTITQTDLFKALITLTGLSKRGIQFAIKVEDRPGSIKEVADVIRKYGGRIASILTSYEEAPEGYRVVYLRMYGVERESLLKLKEEIKTKAELRYMVDLKENEREIYS